MTEKKSPENAAIRLSFYLRCLRKMKKEKSISSERLAQFMGTSGVRVRKDLSYFGQFGTRGKGYMIGELQEQISKILGLDRVWTIALVGVGKLGTALMGYPGFRKSGFHIKVGFDVKPSKIGRKIASVPVYHPYRMPTIIRAQKIRMGMITVPAEAAQESADLLIISGIRAILNFSPAVVVAPSYVKLTHVDFTTQLEIMTYFIINRTKEKTQTKLL